MLKILVVSDIHGASARLKELKPEAREADALVVGGDLTHFGGASQALEILDLLLDYGLPTVAVHGNCDRQGVVSHLDERGVAVHDRWASLKGVPLLGWGGSLPAPMPTPSTYREEEAAEALDKHTESLPDTDWIFLSHQPPFESEADMIGSGDHVGSRAVGEFIRGSRPALVICGHIHESYSVSAYEDSLLLNPGSLKEGRYGVVDWNGKESTAELRML